MKLFLKTSDTSVRLAARWYGPWWLYRLIEDLNPHVYWNSPQGGVSVELPDVPTQAQPHTVKAGDTYQSLSRLYYGTEIFDWLIERENQLKIIYEMIGETIKIPPLADGDRMRRMRSL